MNNILEVNVDDNGYGGVYAFVLNILKNIGPDYHLDLCTFEHFEQEENIYDIQNHGGDIIFCGYDGTRNPIKKQFHCFKNLCHLISERKYQAVHIHADVSYKLFLYALAARIGGARKVLVHSHSTGVEGRYRNIKKMLQSIFKLFLPLAADELLACSKKAGKWMYFPFIRKGKRYHVINVCIETSNYSYDPQRRNIIRNQMNLEDIFTIGHVGRFSYPKNHLFLIDIFNEVCKKNPKSQLLLIGTYVGSASYLDAAKEKVNSLGLNDKVKFLGIRHDVPDLLQAMDCFLLPSRFEGLPTVGIEAQAAGLPCFFSNTITREIGITKLAHFISLKESPKVWARQIVEKSCIDRENMSNIIKSAGFDIQNEISKLEQLYSE
ncbi:glycosyltransferase [uncultured Megasphaera sp.]|uniref:glycosyltransferase n=1 Tax=uncultured Megasphaera sp. TaxID=165188 RepID=UPI0025E5A96D|nr:glycosyltransferase [uncultured Megasphaera sp.]